MRISLDRFQTALEKVKKSSAKKPKATTESGPKPDSSRVTFETSTESVPKPDFSKVACKTSLKTKTAIVDSESKHSKQSSVRVESKFGFTIGDRVKVLNIIKSKGFVIPEKYKYGTVTHFNKRFVFFTIQYLKEDQWHSYEAHREPHNLSHANK